MRRLLALLLLAAACNSPETPESQASRSASGPAGNAERGREVIARYGCNVCHTVPGIEGPQGSLAPTLAGVATRPTLSNGTVTNTPENLARFIVSPGSMNPATRMPGAGLSNAEAADVTAYLLTLR